MIICMSNHTKLYACFAKKSELTPHFAPYLLLIYTLFAVICIQFVNKIFDLGPKSAQIYV